MNFIKIVVFIITCLVPKNDQNQPTTMFTFKIFLSCPLSKILNELFNYYLANNNFQLDVNR